MFKKLLILTFALPWISNSQTLQTEAFTILTPGNIGTNMTGASSGQDSWFTFSSNGTTTTSTNAANSNFQATATGNPSNGLLIEGPNGDKGSRYMWKDGLPTAWAARTSGNNIIEVEVDINTGVASTSRNTFGVYIFNGAGDRVLAGFTVRAATKEIFLVAYSTPGANPVGNYSYTLAAAPGIQLPENTWSRIGISFNTVTGRAILKGPGINPSGAFVDGSSAGTDPAEIDIVSFSGHVAATPNTSSASMLFDNIAAKASATDTLLGNDDFNFSDDLSSIIMYPNPAKDNLNIQSKSDEVTRVAIIDLNGRLVKEARTNLNQISLEGIAKGLYMVEIETTSDKKIKKLIIE